MYVYFNSYIKFCLKGLHVEHSLTAHLLTSIKFTPHLSTDMCKIHWMEHLVEKDKIKVWAKLISFTFYNCEVAFKIYITLASCNCEIRMDFQVLM